MVRPYGALHGTEMEKLNKILCVVDTTTGEQYAVDRAAWLCGKSGAKLELVIVCYNEYLSGERLFDGPSLEKARKEVVDGHRAQLESIARPLRDTGLDVTNSVVWDRPLFEGIIRHATAADADLVVKETHYHTSLARALLTNTDWQLIRNCAMPLWLVKPRPVQDRPVFIAAIDPMNEHDKPAALDDEIIVTGKAIAEHCGAELHVFHAYDPSTAVAAATANAYLPVSLPFDELDEQMRETHGKRFYEITGYHDIAEARTHLVSGRTEIELPELAAKLDGTLVVMGAVARNHLKRLFVGATAERTLDKLPCDLLIIKPDWFQTPAEIPNNKERSA